MVDEVCVSAVNRFIECLRSLSQPETKVKVKRIVRRDFFSLNIKYILLLLEFDKQLYFQLLSTLSKLSF
jgi:hypothetical protein